MQSSSAIQNAASIAGLMLTTEALVRRFQKQLLLRTVVPDHRSTIAWRESGPCEVNAGQELPTTRRLMECSKCQPHSGNLPGPRLHGSYGFDGRPLAGSPV